MIRNLLTSVRSLLFLIACCIGFPSIAQLTATEQPVALTVCADSTSFSLTLHSGSQGLSDIIVSVNFPEGIVFTGTVNGATLEVNDPVSPLFRLDTLAPGKDTVITYFVHAECSIITGITGNLTVQDSITLNYFQGSQNLNFEVPRASYNILYPQLIINVIPDGNSGSPVIVNIGEVHNAASPFIEQRRITIQNSGNGAVEEVRIFITPEPEITYTGFVGSNSTAALPFTSSSGEIIITLRGTDLANASTSGSMILGENDVLEIIEEFTVVSCNGGDTQYRVEWGCDGEVCNAGAGEASRTASVETPAQTAPNITYTTVGGDGMANYCGLDTILTFNYTNSATNFGDFARNVMLEVLSNENFAFPTGFELFEYRLNGQLIPTAMIETITGIPQAPNPNPSNARGIRIHMDTNTNALFGFNDSDNDGAFDDIDAGGSVQLTARFRFIVANLNLDDCPFEYDAVFGRSQSRYSSQCGEVFFTSGIGQQYSASHNLQTGSFPTTQGPSDMTEGEPATFRFCTGNWGSFLGFLSCTENEYSVVANLPAGYTVTGPITWFSNAGDSFIVPGTQTGNVLTIQGGGTSTINANNWTGCYQLQLQLNCAADPVNNTPTGGLSWTMNYQCDDCMDLMERACGNSCLNNHFTTCEVPDTACLISARTTDFTIERTTLGWTDYTRKTTVTPTTPGIDLHAAYPFDTIRMTTTGVIDCNDFDDTLRVFYQGINLSQLQFVSGTFNHITGTGTTSCTVARPSTTVVHAGVTLQEIIAPCINSGAAVGDSVIFNGLWVVTNALTGNFPPVNLSIRSGFYADSLPVSTGGNCAGIPNAFAEPLTLLSIASHPIFNNDGANDCDATTVTMSWHPVGGRPNADDFPNEFRNIGRINDTVPFFLPDGYSFVAGSARMNYISVVGGAIPSWNVDSSVVINPDTVIIDSNNYLRFHEEWPLVDKSNGSSPILSFRLQPTCERNDTIYGRGEFAFLRYHYSTNPVVHQERQWTQHEPYNAPTNSNVSWRPTLPNLTFTTGLATIDAFEQVAEWSLRICNLTDNLHPLIETANGVWIDVDPGQLNAATILLDTIYEVPGGTPLINTHYGERLFVQAGNVIAGTCRNFILEAHFTNCIEDALDTIHVMSGWNCGPYPDPFTTELDTAVCHINSDTLFIRYKTADLAMQVFAPTGQHGVCDTLHYVVELQSTGPATMFDLDFWADLPAGVTLESASYTYPVTGTPQSLPAPSTDFTGGNPSGWHLSDIVTGFSPDGGFTGSLDTTRNELLLNFDVIPGCGYNPIQPLTLHASGVTNCNDTLVLNSNQPFTLSDFDSLDVLGVQITAPDTMQCSTTAAIQVTVTNNGTFVSNPNDSLHVNPPVGFTYLGGSNGIAWSVPALNPGESFTYTFNVTATDTSNCATFSMPAFIDLAQTTTCNGDTCRTNAVLAQASAPIVICCETCTVNAAFIANDICLGNDPACFTLVDPTTAGSGYSHSWDFGDSDISTDPQPCHLYGSGTFQVIHQVTDSTGCSDVFVDSIRVTERPEASIELLGCNPFCEGDTVYLIVNGVYDSIAWIMLPLPGTIVGTTDTLTVTQPGTYTAELYYGACVSNCLAINVQQQPTPDIDIPDDTLCPGQTITVCAGSGYMDYEWTYEGTVINSTDSCINVSLPGTYTVSVGQQLTFGCCICHGSDTFTIYPGDLNVELMDSVLCVGETLNLCPVITGGLPAYTYAWTPTGETTSCINVSASGTYAVTVTDARGCVDSDSAVIITDSISDPFFTFEDTVCINRTACFFAVQQDGFHTWEITDQAGTVVLTTSGEALDSLCHTFAATGSFVIAHTISNGCGDSTYVDTVTIVPPIDACIVMTGQNPFCEGDQVCLSVNDPFNQVTEISWYQDSVLVFVGDTFCVTEPGIYSAEITDNNGCVNACMCIVLTQIPVPVVNLPDSAYFCNTDSVTLDAGSGFSQYLWYKDGAPFAFGVHEITVNEAGTYTVTVTGANGCEATDSTIVTDGNLNITLQASALVVCISGTVTLYTECRPNQTYVWEQMPSGNPNWAPVPGAGNVCSISRQLFRTTRFRVIVTNTLTGCRDTAQILIVARGILCLEIVLSPNPPVAGLTTLFYGHLEEGEIGTVTVELKNVLGETLMEFPLDFNAQFANIDVSGLAQGTYMISVLTDGKPFKTEKLVIAE